MIWYSSIKEFKLKVALAGLVLGKVMVGNLISLNNFLYKLDAVLPFKIIIFIWLSFNISFKSLGITSFIEASLEPLISQDAQTSYNAIWCFSKNAFLSFISSSKILDKTGQKRF